MAYRYSLNGYINLLNIRSKKTILVEGRSDKNLLHRISLEISHSANFLIDESNLIDDDVISGLGAKERIRKISGEARKSATANPKLVTFVDREWEGQIQESNNTLMPWKEPAQSDRDFVTIGHSIENYVFLKDFICDYLAYMSPQCLSDAVRRDINDRFQDIIILAIAFSDIARQKSCLSKLKGSVNIQSIEFKDSGFVLNSEIDSEIYKRTGLDCVSSIVNKHKLEIFEYYFDSLDSAYLIHGHIGDDVIWSCIAVLLTNYDVLTDEAQSICLGHKAERERFWRDWLAKQDANLRRPIDSVFSTLVDEPPPTPTPPNLP